MTKIEHPHPPEDFNNIIVKSSRDRKINALQHRFASIIIPTYRERNYLPRLLENVRASNFNRNRVEVIVSDSGSDDGTIEYAQQFGAQNPDLNFKMVKAGKSVSYARNDGAAAAEGDDLIFLDADSQINRTFVDEGLDELRSRELEIGGCYAVPDSNKWYDRLAVWAVNQHGAIAQYTSRPLIVGAGMFVTRDLFQKLGGFKQMKFGEDLQFGKEAAAKTKFRMLNSARFVYDMRRFQNEGRWTVLKKAVEGQWHYVFGDLVNIGFDYEFGKFGPKKDPQDKSK